MTMPRRTPLVHYLIRRVLMHTPLVEQSALSERPLQAEAEIRARRLRTLRRLERKAQRLERQLRLARLRLQ